ncbi:MAG: hypothetical protein ACLUI7_01975 [Coprococcus sp.]
MGETLAHIKWLSDKGAIAAPDRVSEHAKYSKSRHKTQKTVIRLSAILLICFFIHTFF